MASRTTKNQKKVKKAKEPIVVRGNVTVRDCMTWHYQEGYKPDQDSVGGARQPRDFHLSVKPDIGRSRSRGYEMPPPPPAGPYTGIHETDGRVIDALRGWSQNQQDGVQQVSDVYYADQGQLPGGDYPEKKGDPWMGDLISHKFMSDAIRRRREEEEEELRKAAGKAKKSGRGKTDIKGNRTSQLRAIALGEKVEVSPHELWQMSKFKKNARPHISTQNKRVGNKSGKGGANRNGNDVNEGGGDPCTCYDANDGILDENRPDSNDVHHPEYDRHAENNMYHTYGDENDASNAYVV